jgi:hypothetical protein
MSLNIKRAVAEGDLVVTHSLLKTSTEDRGTAAADIFRLEEGKVVEHGTCCSLSRRAQRTTTPCSEVPQDSRDAVKCQVRRFLPALYLLKCVEGKFCEVRVRRVFWPSLLEQTNPLRQP